MRPIFLGSAPKPGGPTPYLLSQIFIQIAILLAITIFFTFGAQPAFATNTGQFTAEVWVKPSTSIASKAILGKSEELRIFTDASGFVGCQIKASSTWQTAAQATTNALTLNTWSHIACTYDKVNLRVYLNGTQIAQTALTSAPDDTANNFLIGEDDSASTTYTNLVGTVDNFQFYNYARTAKQIQADMGTGLAQKEPVGFWKFDEGYLTTAHNSGSGGSSLNGTLSGTTIPTWTNSGKFGKALTFSGDDYVNLTNDTSLQLTSGTISAWIKTADAGSSYRGILTKQLAYGMFLKDNVLIIYDWGTSSDRTTGVNLGNSAWHHVLFTFQSGVTNGTIVYVDGVAKLTTTMTISNQTVALIAGGGGINNQLFSGLIDEPKIYPYALTADEVKTEYNQGQSLQLGALGSNTSYAPQATNQIYCVPGDTSSCAPPVAEWTFDEGKGTSVKDTSGNNNLGTWSGTGTKHWDVGKIGSAGKFNGSNDYVAGTGGTNLYLTTTFTLESWVKLNSLTAPYNNPEIINKSGTLGNEPYRFHITPTALQLTITDATNNRVYPSYATTWSLNRWYHVATTFDNGTVNFYIDGILKKTTSAGIASVYSAGTTGFYLGYRGQQTNFVNGNLDQVRVFNYARSGAQIAWDYNRGAPVGWWKFDECQGTTAHDASGNNNSGTITVATGNALGTCTTASTFWGGSGGTGAGKINYAPTFDGVDDKVSTVDPGTSSVLDVESRFSVCSWFKSTNSDERILVEKGPWSGSWLHFLKPSGGLLKSAFAASGWNPVTLLGNTTISTGNWYHICTVWDGTNRKIYLNGILDGSDVPTGSLTANNSDLTIGNRSNSDIYAFKGQIDEVKVFNYALTTTQVKTLFNNGAVSFGPVTGSP